jgi:hypothetical protein
MKKEKGYERAAGERKLLATLSKLDKRQRVEALI